MTIDVKKEREFLAALDGHTPGPWFRDCWDILSDGPGTGAVCDVAAPGDSDEHYWTDGEADSNARLISAAPDLKAKYAATLEALDAKEAEIERLREALQNALAAGLPDVVAKTARAALNQETEE